MTGANTKSCTEHHRRRRGNVSAPPSLSLSVCRLWERERERERARSTKQVVVAARRRRENLPAAEEGERKRKRRASGCGCFHAKPTPRLHLLFFPYYFSASLPLASWLHSKRLSLALSPTTTTFAAATGGRYISRMKYRWCRVVRRVKFGRSFSSNKAWKCCYPLAYDIVSVFLSHVEVVAVVRLVEVITRFFSFTLV